MTLDEAIRRNPYNPIKGNEAAYCRYLRYNVDGWYQLDSKEVRSRWQKRKQMMKEVELVIKIPEETYKGIMLGKWDENGLAYYVKDGTPLPKGHGRLIDADALEKKMCDREEELGDDRALWESSAVSVALDMFASTIIEKDDEVES